MKSHISQLWQVIRAREQGLAATTRFFSEQIQHEQNRRALIEAETKRHRVRLIQTEQQVAVVDADRRRELAAKEKSLRSLQAEIEAHQRWEKLCHEAERQVATLKKQLATEVRARATARKLLQQTEQQIATVDTNRRREMAAKDHALRSLQAEAAAHQRWEKLCHEAEQHVATLKKQIATEAGAHATAQKLLQQAERQIAAVDLDRQREAATKDQARQALQAEAAAHQRWEQLCHEAEQQIATVRKQLAAEAGAHATTGKLLQQTEQRVATVEADRQRELAAKIQVQQALKAEAAAHQRWATLCHEAEHQRTILNQQLALETGAHTATRKLLTQTEQQVTTAQADRQREAAAKEKSRQLLKTEAEAQQRWATLCHEAEQQLATVRKQLATEANAHATARKLLQQTEQRVATVEADRQREATAKDQTLHALKAEAAAHQRWATLCREAEQQRTILNQQLALEASAHTATRKLLTQTEQQVAAAQADRQREAAAKEKSRQLLQAEAAAHQRWAQLCREAEQQVSVLNKQLALEVGAHATARKLLQQTEQRLTVVEADRQRELAAKDQARQLLQAEAAAHQHWATLCREAEQQLTTLRTQLVQTEQQVAAAEANRLREVGAKEQALKAEVAAHQRRAQLCREAEQQVSGLNKQLALEVDAHAAARKLLQQTEQRLTTVEADRQRELAAKDQARQLLQAEAAAKEKSLQLLQAEAAAHQHRAQLCREAEQQISVLNKQLALEVGAHATARKLLQQAERQIAAVDLDRQREAATKDQARQALQAETAAHQRWAARCREAEQQLTTLRTQRVETEQRLAAVEADGRRALADKALAQQSQKTETAARQHWEKLYHGAEPQLATLRQQLAETQRGQEQERDAREQEARAKDHALAWARAAETAKATWERLCHEAEAQRDMAAHTIREIDRKLRDTGALADALQEKLNAQIETGTQQASALADLTAQQAQAAAELSASASLLAQAAFARDLAAEQHRQHRLRHTLFGRWLAMRNASARLVRRLYCFARSKPFVPPETDREHRIAQINTHDIIGGAERASYDLHVQFRRQALNPSLTVGGKHGHDEDVFPIPFQSYDWKPAAFWRDRWGVTEVLYPTPILGCFKWPHLRQAHVIHIHNMHGHYWNSATLLPFGMQHPVVLTLHDEYTMTGDCCYSYDCERWTRGCGKCPQIGLARAQRYALGGQDRTRLNIQLKRAIFRAPRAYPLVIVTPSRWLAARARRAPNLRHLPVISINNGVDLDYWQPQPQSEARQTLGLPEGKTIGLVVANHISDRRKGFDCALAAIRLLPRETNLLFVIVGNITDEIKATLAGLPVIALGFVSEKSRMRSLFSAADFTFSMSRMDNLPYMCVESLACGRPVFGSAVGGIPEIIDEPALGWLTPLPFDHQSIALTLAEIDRETPAQRQQRFAACRRSAEARFSLKLMVARHLALYQELLSASRDGRAPDLEKLVPDHALTS